MTVMVVQKRERGEKGEERGLKTDIIVLQCNISTSKNVISQRKRSS